MKRKSSGFTIVELLIVIVIIGILAALVIVAYNGLQVKARDVKRKSDLAYIAKALKLYETDNGNFIGTGSGCGYMGTGIGHFNYQDGASYPDSIHNCLKNAGYLSGNVVDPSGNTSCTISSGRCYMKYNCGTSVYIYANLESLLHTSTDTDSTCQPSLDTLYGMNYFVKVE